MRRVALVLLALSIAGCGGGGAERAEEAESPPAGGVSAGGDARPERVALSAADVEAFERGLARETEAVRASQAAASAAKTPAERGAAIQAGFEQATMVEGAKAAGMSEERYRAVRETLVEVLQTLDFQGAIDGPMSLDTARAPEDMKRKLARDPIADLPGGGAAAVRARLPQLEAVWKEYAGLVAVAG